MSSGTASRRWFHTGLLAGSFLTVMWGTLAFGAVYPWAYKPLMIACGSLGAVALLLEWRGRPRIGLLTIGLSAIALSIALQLVPVSTDTVAALSPGGDAFLRRYDLSYGVPRVTDGNPSASDTDTATHPLSIAPERTALGLSLYVPLAIFFLGMIRLLSVTGAAVLAKALTIFGVVLAFIGIAQYELSYTQVHPLVYGFWKPRYDGRPFGPFINANHFAGWMLLVLPVTLGVFYDTLSQALDEASTYGKNRMALAGSPRIGSLIVLGFSSVVMGLALIMTRSRSGIGAFAIGSALAGTILWRQQKTGKARAIVLVSFLALFGGAAVWAGAESFLSKFASPLNGSEAGSSLGGRIGAWRDTLRIVRDSPYTGTGLNTFGTAMVLYQTGTGLGRFQEAHNDYLQIAAEGGLLIGIPVLFTLGVFVWNIRRRFHQAPKGGSTYWIRIGAVIGLILIALQSLLEFSLQMPGNAALFALVAALAVHQSPHLRRL